MIFSIPLSEKGQRHLCRKANKMSGSNHNYKGNIKEYCAIYLFVLLFSASFLYCKILRLIQMHLVGIWLTYDKLFITSNTPQQIAMTHQPFYPPLGLHISHTFELPTYLQCIVLHKVEVALQRKEGGISIQLILPCAHSAPVYPGGQEHV